MKAENGNEIALLAHDLRTPLAAMRTTAELIAKGELSDEQSEYLSILLRSIDALADMTGDLVRPAAHGGQRNDAPRDAVALVREVCDLFRPLAEKKGLCFETRLENSELPIEAARAAPLRRVVTTLIDNAIKYTAEGGVTIALHGEPSVDGGDAGLSVSVADTGPGIDRFERERLFAPFVRGKTGRASGEGSGLGLWGAGQLVKGLGGRLRLSSPKSGGCRFEVALPLKTGPLKTGPLQTGSLQTGPKAVPDAQAEGELDCFPHTQDHILIVDDNDTNRRLLSAVLESFGMTCEEAESGPMAIELLKARTFDAVLLDLHMPGMSGLEAAEKLLQVRPEEKVPLIAVTAAMEAVGDKRLKDVGFLEVLAKPLSPAHLFQALEHARDYRQKDMRPDAPAPL